MRRRILIFGFVLCGCGSPLWGSPAPQTEPRSETLDNERKTPPVDGQAKAGAEPDIGETKQVHDVFSMGPYRVDLVSQEGKCFAEVYGHGDPIYGPNLTVPLELNAPCFVKRRVLTFAQTARSRSKPTSPLGGAFIHRQRDGSAEVLVTMLIGEPLAPNLLKPVKTRAQLRCGHKWVYFSVRSGTFRVSDPKTSDEGFCALKGYIDHMREGAFDLGQLGDRTFKLPPEAKGRVLLPPQKPGARNELKNAH